MSGSARWLLVGPRSSRRIAGMQAALRARGLPAAVVVDYADLLTGAIRLETVLAGHPDALVKLESPGEAPALHDALVRRGWELAGGPGAPPAPLQHGELAHQQYWSAGFTAVLAAMPADARYLNSPAELSLMTDKLACQQRLADAGVEVPPLFGAIAGHDQLHSRLDTHACDSVFIKARYGSSGAGVLAYRRHRAGREVATGPIELVVDGGRTRLFNSLRQRRYEDRAQIARLVDALAHQGAYVERWIPKPAVPGAEGGHFDIRAVALDGRPRQRIARCSRGPLTNLHLGNRRLPVDACLDRGGQGCLESAVARAAAAFPSSRMIGFDLIVRGPRAWVLEANGFGDLLLDVRHEGRSVYEDQARLGLREAPRPLGEPAHV
ncbi:hypothetical protein C9I47_0900 [Lysobacter maris]|uniref:ATP-grasp domain-containing protein n=1 Tax=Marilutibacter maris TaxID=1605891 RepID=A0A2U9T2H5_9GAMM|nr:STM4014 family protein [Lysobacter maris]AWV06621.1 hypothetical protein C9I47_0900 [Lysobacter maris]